MNVSLTAVGMLWSVVDFIARSEAKDAKGADDVLPAVWDAMLDELGKLSVDRRPEVSLTRAMEKPPLFTHTHTHTHMRAPIC